MTNTKTAEQRARLIEIAATDARVIYEDRLLGIVSQHLKAHAAEARREFALNVTKQIANNYAQPVRAAHSENAADGAWAAISIIQEQLGGSDERARK